MGLFSLASQLGISWAKVAVASVLPPNGATLTDPGGLMSYGPDIHGDDRRVAGYVKRILKGANPAEMPVEQPMRLELILNLKTAKALGQAIPQSVLLQTDEVLQ